MADEHRELHVVMVPWLAFGHLIPFLELSKALARRGIITSFISTPKNIDRLPKIPDEIAPLIRFVSFPLPHVDGLQEGAEATLDLELDKVPYLKKAYDGLSEPFEKFVESVMPDWMILDFAPFWAANLATKLSIPCAFHFLFSAVAGAVFGSPSQFHQNQRVTIEDWTSVPNWIPFPSVVKYRRFEILKILKEFRKSGDALNICELSEAERCISVSNASQVVLVRSCKELEGDYLKVFEGLYKKPVRPIGLLPPSPESWDNDAAVIKDPKWVDTLDWLDKQGPKSTVFVGFGTECKLSVEEIHEISLGLESSGFPFIWILKKPPRLAATNSIDIFPDGFLDRVSDRGKVCIGWAPQVKILSHRSIGCCMIQCGCGTIIESLQFGHPLVLVPMVYDQGLNARFLADEKGVGVEVERDEEDGRFSKEGIGKALRLVMVDEVEGEGIRVKAKEMISIYGNKNLQEQYLDELVEYLNQTPKDC